MAKRSTRPATNIASFAELDAAGFGLGYRPTSYEDAAEPLEEQPSKPSKRTTARAAGDVGLALGQGAVGAFKSISDIFGADNAVSSTLGDVNEGLQNLKSDQSKATLANSQRRIQEAEATGDWKNEAAATMQMLWDQLPEMLAQGGGSFATLGIGKLAQAAKLTQAAKAAGVSKAVFLDSPAGREAAKAAAEFAFKANVAVGAGQGVGAVKGSQYEQTLNAAKAQGMGDAEARSLASEAQAYGGPGTMQQLLGGVLGSGASATGPIERMVAGKAVSKGPMTLMGGLAKGFATESGTEGAQGAQERYAGNDAAIDAGVLDESARWRGVAGQGVQEGVVGGLLGAGPGGLEAMGNKAQAAADAKAQAAAAAQAEADAAAAAIRANMQPGSGPLSNAVNAGTEADAQKVEVAGASAAAAIASAPDLADTAPSTPSPEGSAEFINPDFQARQQTLAEQMASPENREKVRARFGDDGLNQVLYYAQAAGRADIPAKTSDNMLQVAERMMGEVLLQPLGGGAQLGGMVRDPLTLDAPEQTGAQPLGLGLDQTPSGRFTVDAQGNAVQETAVQRGDAQRRAGEMASLGNQKIDILNPSGQPFKTRLAASLAAKKTPGEVVEVPGGYAVRAEQATPATQKQQAQPLQATQQPSATPATAMPTAATPAASAQSAILGRNSQPIAEGGQPFATREEAKAEKRMQPLMRVAPAEGGGFILKPASERQLAAVEKAAKRLKYPSTGETGPRSLHGFILQIGGLASGTMPDIGFDLNPRVGNRRLFFPRGKTIEQAAMAAKQEGYIQDEDENTLIEALKRSMNVSPVYTPDGYEAMAEAQMQARYEDFLAAEQDGGAENDWSRLTPEELADTGYNDYDEATRAEIRALVAQAEALGVDAESILEDVAQRTENATQKDYENAAKSAIEAAIEAAIRSSEESRSRDLGQAGAEAGPAAADTPAAPAAVTGPASDVRARNLAALKQRMMGQKKPTPTTPPAPNQQATPAPEAGPTNQGATNGQGQETLLKAEQPTGADVSVSGAPVEKKTTDTAKPGGAIEKIRKAAQSKVDTAPVQQPSGSIDGIVIKPGNGLIKGKFKAEVDGVGLPGDAFNTEQEAYDAALKYREVLAKRANEGADAQRRKDAIADSFRNGDQVTNAQIESLGLKSDFSDMRWFMSTAADLFGLNSRQIRPIVKDLIKVRRSDMGTEYEYVPTRKALEAIAASQSLTSPTKADIEAQQARAEQAAKAKAAQDKADTARSAKERERKDVAAASVAAADTFELGQDAIANLTGQQDVFGAMEQAAQPTPPKATELTPKQFHEAKLAFIAADTGASMADVRENYDTEAGRAENNREWAGQVERAAKAGEVLTSKTLDKLYKLAPNVRLPETAIPQGYQRPEARRAEADDKQARVDGRKAAKAGVKDAAPSFTDLEKELQAQSHATELDGDIGIVAGGGVVRYVSLDDAVSAAKKAIEVGVKAVPFQIHNATGIRIGDVDRVLGQVNRVDYSKRSVDWLRQNGGDTISVSDAIAALVEKQKAITGDVKNWTERDEKGHPVKGIALYNDSAAKKLDAISWAITNLMGHRKKHGDAPLNAAKAPDTDENKVPLSSVIDKVNAKNGQGLTDADLVPEKKPESKTPSVDAHAELMDAVRDGKATPEQFKAGFEAAVSGADAIKAELATKTKSDLLKMGGYAIRMRYANDTKTEIIDALYREMLGEFVLGESLTYGMGKNSYQNAIRQRVEATDADKLAKYAVERKAAMEEYAQRRFEAAKAIANPQKLEDFRGFIRAEMLDGKTRQEAYLALSPEQRIRFDELEAESTREARETRKRAQKTQVQAAGQTTGGQIIETKHTKAGYDLFVVQLSDRLSKEDYSTVLASAKRLGGWYSAFRGNGAVPGFQFKERASAEAFLKLAGGDTSMAAEQVAVQRDAFEDDKTQTAAERLNEMADKLEERADEELGRERNANTARRARFAASAEAAASNVKALAKTMRNIAKAIGGGTAKFLDAVRTKTQVEMLSSMVNTAKYNELVAKFPEYADREKRKGEPPTVETADFAEFPTFTAFRSDLATLARQMLEVDGTKKIGQQLMSVADDVTDAYLEFAKKNILAVSQFGRGGAMADFTSKSDAEAAIRRSGLVGKAIVLPIKRGENRVILSPSEAMNRKVWSGDGDKRITLTKDAGMELVQAIGRKGNKENRLTVPWQFENAADRLNALSRIGIETPSEFRSAIREFIAMRVQAQEADRVKAMERAMVGRKNDGLDFFPTPAEVADQMVEAAGIDPDMAVLEPSAGMGHLADRIRAAGAEPDVIELSGDRRELLTEKGFNVIGTDFMAIEPRSTYTYGDVFRHKDGRVGILGSNGGMGSARFKLIPMSGDKRVAEWVDIDDLTGIEKRGSSSGYDRIIMNPPFGDRRDAAHVQHAYSMLKPGGRLVAIMGEGVFFGKDKKAEEFRDWLDGLNGTSEKLPAGSFMDTSLPVTTGVNARMVVVDKPASAIEAQQSTRPTKESPRTPASTIRTSIEKAYGTLLDKLEGKGLVTIAQTEREAIEAAAQARADKTGGDAEAIAGRMMSMAGLDVKYSANGNIEGFFDKQTGKSFLVADNLTAASAPGTLMHEVGIHMAAGGKLEPLFKRAGSLLKTGTQNEFIQRVKARMARAGETSDEEAAAYIVTEYENDRAKAPITIGKWLADLTAAVRAWLFSKGIILKAEQLTVADIAAVARANARSMARGGPNGGPGGGRAFSRTALPATLSIDGKDRPTTNSKGQPIHPTEEGVRNFWRWFSDSRVVDDLGRPLVVYHGTAYSFDEFDPGMAGATYGADDEGIFFTTDTEEADVVSIDARNDDNEDQSGSNVMPVFLSFKNPLTVSFDEFSWQPWEIPSATNTYDSHKERILSRFRAGDDDWNDYDGIVIVGKDNHKTFVAFEPTQVKSATGNTGAFSAADPDIRFSRAADMAGNAIDKARQTADKAMGKDFPRAASMPDLNDDQRSLLGKVGASQSPASDAIKAATDRAGLKIRQGMVDRFAALKDLDEKALGQNFISDSITNSAWVLAKMSSAGSGALNAMMKSGRIEMDATQKVIGLKGAPNGGLTASLQKLGGPAEVERFFAWMAANRAEKLMAEGRENLFTPAEIAAGKTLNTGTTEGGKVRPALYSQVHAEFQQYRDDVLAIAEQAGIINSENRAMWRDEFYVPFYRVMEDDADRGRSGGNGLSRQEAYKKLKGGKQNLNDLMENTLMNFHHLLSASLKNQAAVQAIKNAETVGIARKVPEARRDTKTSTFVLVDGKKVFYEVDDPLVFESITTLADPGLNNTAVRVMGAFKRLFTNMTTATPQFIIANTFRDLLQASATSPTSKNIAKNLKEGIQSYRDEKTRAEMLASGGAFSFGHIYGMSADEVKESLQKTVAGAGLISSPSMIPSMMRKMWDAWSNITDLSENASRAATYTQNVDQMGKLRAAFEARDAMDFSQHGAWPAVRLLVRIVPFLNARLQGLDKLYRSGLKPSILTAMGKGTDTDKQAAARFAMVTGALTLATMALYLINADDDEYKKLEEWQKDTYWFIRIGENAFFLPKPFEVGAIATIAERTLQQAMDDKATGKLFRERMWDMLMQTFAFNPTPQMFQPLIDVYSNKDAFTGRDIESAGMERMSTGLRSRDSTTAPATALSAVSRVFGDESAVAVSPVQADHLIKGYLGGVGAMAAGWIDTMYRAATGQSSPDKAWSEYQPIRRFYRDLDVPVANTRYATLFYDGLKEANRVYADVMELQKLGRPEDAATLAAEKRNVLQMRIALNAQQRRLTEINNRMKEVRRSDRDGEWKRREIDLLTTQKALITERLGKRIEDARATQ